MRPLLHVLTILAFVPTALAQSVGGFTATLTAHEEVPSNASTNVATSELTFDRGSGTLSGTMTGLGGPATAAHIHDGAVGSNGGVVAGMTGSGTSWSAAGTALSPAQLTDLLHEGLYANYHTTAFPGGELRGQVRIPLNYLGELDASKEVPVTTSTATANATLILNQPAGTLTYNIEVSGTLGTVAHIHRGVAGSNGPIVFALSGGPTVYSGTTPPLSNDDMLDLLSGGLYLNLHSSAFPGGEIRDQIHIGGLNADVNRLGAVNGMTTDLNVSAGASHAGELYLVLGSLSGTSPGTSFGGFIIPLNTDAYTIFTLNNPNTPPLLSSFGILDSDGNATASFDIPGGGALLSFVGLTVQHAAVVIDPVTVGLTYVSNAHGIAIE